MCLPVYFNTFLLVFQYAVFWGAGNHKRKERERPSVKHLERRWNMRATWNALKQARRDRPDLFGFIVYCFVIMALELIQIVGVLVLLGVSR